MSRRFAEQLIPRIESARDVPDRLRQRSWFHGSSPVGMYQTVCAIGSQRSAGLTSLISGKPTRSLSRQ